MLRIQTYGLLADIRHRARTKGSTVVSWKDLEAFAKPMRIKPLAEALADWARTNEMSVEFSYEQNAERRIASATFHASSIFLEHFNAPFV
jgi:hypothetical protein